MVGQVSQAFMREPQPKFAAIREIRVCPPFAAVDLPQRSDQPYAMSHKLSASGPSVLSVASCSKFWSRATLSLVLPISCPLLFSAQAAQLNWPEFRGPWGDGHVMGPGERRLVGFPLHWSDTNNVKWKTEIPFKGWSAPVV